jgi:hypothetical protein
MLKRVGKIGDDFIQMPMGWQNGIFRVHAGNRIARDNLEGYHALATDLPRIAY